MHNQAVKAMRYAENTKAEWESAEEVKPGAPLIACACNCASVS